jgi:TonB-linked SusC/RagA family outer membrane protein
MDAATVVQQAPVANVDQLLAQRSPGLMMLPGGGNVGTGAQIRIRGATSISLTNEPIIYIDGIRVDGDSDRGPGQRGGSNVSRLNDLNPNDIATIEVIKGPAAATLYGTEASNGVIQIITKRGQAGAPQFDVTMRMGTNWLWDPETRAGLRWARDGQTGELYSFNPYVNEIENGKGPIWTNGALMGYAASVRGGTDAVRYFASGTYDDDTGVASWNTSKRLGLRANIEMLLNQTFTLRTSTSYIRSRIRLPATAIGVDPFSQMIWASPAKASSGSRGFYSSPPEEWGEVDSQANNDRTTLSTELQFTPFSWMTNKLIAGIDLNDEVESVLWPRQPEGRSHFFGNQGLGDKSVTRGSTQIVTLDYSGSAKWNLSDFAMVSSVGFQYFRRSSSFISAQGQDFPAVPITTVSGGAVRTGGETFVENATVGVYAQQEFGWKNRLFLTAAVRGDDNSAFGADFNAAVYPKLSAAWVVHEEPWWNVDFVNQFRLRGAWGAAGQQPGTFDAARLYGPAVGYQDNPALLPSAFGNPQLKPERGEELELGFDASFLAGRVTLEYTHYDRTVKDAIVNRPLPPSSGFDGSQIVNIGQVSAWGHEVGINARIMERSGFAWDMDTQIATMNNRIDELGSLEFIGAGGQGQHREGYSIGDVFMYKIVSATIDDGGFVTEALCDGGAGPQGMDQGGPVVPCSEAGKVLWGRSQPTWEVGFGTSVTLWDRLRLAARVEGNGGHWQSNTEIRAQHNLGITQPVLLREDPFLMAYRGIENDATGMYQAGFLRLREISANYQLPPSIAGLVRASGGSVSLGMRNVMMLWTKEEGWGTPRSGMITVPLADMIAWDPEIRAMGQLSNNYQTVMPPTASLTFTIHFTY